MNGWLCHSNRNEYNNSFFDVHVYYDSVLWWLEHLNIIYFYTILINKQLAISLPTRNVMIFVQDYSNTI